VDLPIIELSGSPAHLGESFGEACRDELRELYARRLQSVLRHARDRGRSVTEEQVLDTAGQCLVPTASYDPVGYEEFCGIARGGGISLEQCYVLQGLTDLRDVMALGPAPDGEGCSSFIVAPGRSATGQLLLGQNWDLQTDNMPFVRLVHRRPEGQPETWSLTLTGCLTLIGVNEEGVAVGNTNLQTTDARVGVQYLSVLHRALRATSLDEAAACVRDAPRAGAHYYYLAGPDGAAIGLECSATRAVPFEIDSGVFVHCNHALSLEVATLEAEPPNASTVHRQDRLTHLLESHDGAIGVDDLKRCLSDHDGGPDRCICRHDCEDVSTNATVILSPGTRQIHACRSQPHLGEWVTRTAGG